MSIPKARERLLAEAALLSKSGFHGFAYAIRNIVAEEMHRAPAVRKAPKRIAPLTEMQKRNIRVAAEANPEWSQLQLANYFGTNPGRVSEVLNNKV